MSGSIRSRSTRAFMQPASRSRPFAVHERELPAYAPAKRSSAGEGLLRKDAVDNCLMCRVLECAADQGLCHVNQ